MSSVEQRCLSWNEEKATPSKKTSQTFIISSNVFALNERFGRFDSNALWELMHVDKWVKDSIGQRYTSSRDK